MKRLCAALLLLCLSVSLPAEELVVGSKNFSESYLLAEIMSQLLESGGYSVRRRFGLGGTLICFEALTSGEIDIYPEYSGTIAYAILDQPDTTDLSDINQALAKKGTAALAPLGFNNTYAIAVRGSLAEELSLERLSQLHRHPELRYAFSLEFLERGDGWPGLARTYGLPASPTGIEHGLAYQAINQNRIDLTDAYSTDGDLVRYKLRILEDDRDYFPKYLSLPLARADLPPRAGKIIESLAGRITDVRMRALNARVVIDKASFEEVAAEFLLEEGLVAVADGVQQSGLLPEGLLQNILVHLKLTLAALALGCLVGLPTAILVYPFAGLSRTLVYGAGLLQTIPSIALLALMIPLFGIGELPAIVALFLYSLLPIVRNTITALVTVDPVLRKMAAALGLTWRQQLLEVLLPLGLPTILAGIKTAAVISIGTATLAAFIGAGGLGEPIVTGLALNDPNLILQGAIPAACLAVLVELSFDLLEMLLVKKHLRTAET